MLLESLSYSDWDKKVYLYNDNMEVIDEYHIGECFIDFMDIDFSQYEIFYNDMAKLFNTTYSNTRAKDRQHKTSINRKEATEFFIKYPLIKKEILKNVIRHLETTSSEKRLINIELNNSLFNQYFDFTTEPKRVHRTDYRSTGLSLEEFYLYDEFMFWLGNSLDTVHDLYEQTWNFIYEYENPYINNLSTIIHHPYIMLSNDPDCDHSIVDEVYPHILQNHYKDAFIFCFDVELSPEMNSLSAMERFYLFNTLYPINSIDYVDINTEYRFLDTKNVLHLEKKYSKDRNGSFLEWFKNGILSNEILKQIKNMNIQQFQLYPAYKLQNIINIEFRKMVEHNIKIKKCKNCGKYFILKGDYLTDYCDRIPEGQKITCKKLAAIKTRKQKVNDNPILKEYEKAYKRMYARQSNHKISKEEFRIWTEDASIKRDIFNKKYNLSPSEDLLREFKEFLENK